MATIKDVAQLANVSVSTVSKYINGGTVRGPNAQAIADAIEQLGFRANPFARNLKNQRNRSIGVLLPELLGLDGIWLSVVAAEVLALGVTAACIAARRERYGY